MLNVNSPLVQQSKIIQMLAPATTAAGNSDILSLKGYERATIIITVDNGSAVTGSIALFQTTTVGNNPDVDKTLGFTKVWANVDTGATDTLVETAVTSNTFNLDATANKNLLYVIEVMAEDLDVANGFDCIGVTIGGTPSASVSAIVAILWPARYAKATPVSAILD